jgi:hypothetical protein
LARDRDDPQSDILYAAPMRTFVSTDRGDSWASRNAGLTIAQYYPGISASPSGSTIMGGAQDLGTHFFTGSSYWNGFLSGDGGYTAINYDNPAIRYAETQWLPSGPNLVRSTVLRVRAVSQDNKDDRHAFTSVRDGSDYIFDALLQDASSLQDHQRGRRVDGFGCDSPWVRIHNISRSQE